MSGLSSVDFREVAAALHQSALDSHQIDLSAGRFELTTTKVENGVRRRMSIAFRGITAFKWVGDSRNTGILELSVVGLERLGPAEPWRLYLSSGAGGELELTCGRIECEDIEVTGTGRAYRR